jgi:excisionase family DNA binding protein
MGLPQASNELQPGVSHLPRHVPVVKARMTVAEIACRLDIGRLAVYTMLEQGIIPAIRLGRRWIVTRHAFENWERTCGVPTGLPRRTEQKLT